MKVILNQAVDPRIKLEPNVGSDRSWVWNAYDYADGELLQSTFALRLADSDIANSFRDQFMACQKDMQGLLDGEDKPDADGKAGEAAEALANLTTKDEAKAE
eukprot:CAMPEP_0118711762 /NCGR_PEP_ID=MMETSP0800-20121206/24324_1 /TAXON_ID=210618 ORGANISM="Striatella unipunctata, Strain CCMP2910" /NCGR_SAMPLE_ID=MMETSP0800 /ASSEMBLY_ACC=CAM_ASM_000638 /LENGTH=101 /DNA_ID=CAMNT_0006616505 /DNA_START=168 /DNA_END=473 /DNA_ORIENTATION=+